MAGAQATQAGRPYGVNVDWTYTRETDQGSHVHHVSETRHNPHVLREQELLTNRHAYQQREAVYYLGAIGPGSDEETCPSLVVVSDTRVFDRPAAGRAWFEAVIRDHLDIGRPDQVALIFGRRINRRTPGTFRTKVVANGVDPQLTCFYKSSRLKQYFKEHRALRTETVVGDTRDFGIGRRLCAENWNALRAVGDSANRRLCDAEAADARPAPDVATFTQVTLPSTDVDGLHAPGLRFGDPRVMALLAALVGFAHLLAGFSNRQLVPPVAALLDSPYTSRQATYDLRRLRRKGLIERLPHSFRYQLTPLGRRVAVLFTKTYGRVLAPGLTELDAGLAANVAIRSPLASAWRRLDHELDDFIHAQLLAAS